MAQKTGKVGGQLKNTLAVKHGCYRDLQRVDGRTLEGKALQAIEASLVTDLGGDLSTQQIMAVKRAAIAELRCELYERHFLELLVEARRSRKSYTGLRIPHSLEKAYLRWVKSLMDIIKTLGMKRQAKPVQSLQSYLANGEE